MVSPNRICGNCSGHAPYEYPEKIFCERRFVSGEDDYVKGTFDLYKSWTRMENGACNCIKDYLNKRR